LFGEIKIINIPSASQH